MLVQESTHDVPTTADGQGSMRKYIPALAHQLLSTTTSSDVVSPIAMDTALTTTRHLCLPPHNPRLPQSTLPGRRRLQRDLPRWELPGWHSGRHRISEHS